MCAFYGEIQDRETENIVKNKESQLECAEGTKTTEKGIWDNRDEAFENILSLSLFLPSCLFSKMLRLHLLCFAFHSQVIGKDSPPQLHFSGAASSTDIKRISTLSEEIYYA